MRSMHSSTMSVDATPWLLLLVAVVVVASLTYNRVGRCAVCGGKRVLRMGSLGPFLGCSNYPRCHGSALTSGARIPLATRGKGPLPPRQRRRGGDHLASQVVVIVLLVLILVLLSHH